MRLAAMPDPAQPAGEFTASVGGLHTRPATVAYDGSLAGIQIDLTPAGARALLGVPSGELGPRVVHLEDLLGPDGVELTERVAAAPDWRSRFAVLDMVLQRRMDRLPEAHRSLDGAWTLILRHGGTMPVSTIADQVGWSRRQLVERFTREYGLSVKEASRVVRFHRSRLLLQQRIDLSIGAVAALTGYYDQAHMAREWRSLAGCSPATWLATEELSFVQDGAGEDAGD
jgi:AraC-like DNA-binding protein